MPDHGPPSTRPGRPVGAVIGGLLVVAALLLGCGGGGALASSAIRAGQDTDRGVIGMAVFDMHEGDDYWIYQPAGSSWPDSIECVYSGPPDHTYVVTRSGAPFGAPETRTDRGEDFTYYGTLRGHRTQATVLVECPFDVYLLVPSRAPRWYLGAVVAGAGLLGLAGLAVILTSAARRRRHRSAGPPVPGVAGPAVPGVAGPAVPGVAGPPVPAGRGGPSRAWYLAVIPFLLVAVCACAGGALGGFATGFSRSFEAPDIGTPGAGTVQSVYSPTVEYVLYADETDAAIADPAGCVLYDQNTGAVLPLRLQTDRPFGIAETISRNEHTYRYAGRFRVADVVLGTVRCGEGPSLLVRPSERPRLLVWAGFAVAAAALVVAATIAIGIAVRRRRAPTGRSVPARPPTPTGQRPGG